MYYNEESIYNLVPKTVIVPEKKPIPRTKKPDHIVVPNSTLGNILTQNICFKY